MTPMEALEWVAVAFLALVALVIGIALAAAAVKALKEQTPYSPCERGCGGPNEHEDRTGRPAPAWDRYPHVAADR